MYPFIKTGKYGIENLEELSFLVWNLIIDYISSFTWVLRKTVSAMLCWRAMISVSNGNLFSNMVAIFLNWLFEIQECVMFQKL